MYELTISLDLTNCIYRLLNASNVVNTGNAIINTIKYSCFIDYGCIFA